jgi:DNA polymerase I-like protein with 3'-5' exonuclease and polymerase domains
MSTDWAQTLFTQLTRPFIIPANGHGEGLHLIFDLEADGLLETVTRVHCIVITDLGDARVHEYGPNHIGDALAHLARADVLIGHNIVGYDLPVLRKLHGWTPQPACRSVDTLIAARLILPHLDRIDAEVAARTKDAAFGQVHGRYSLEAFGLRLGVAKIGAEIDDWSKWTPEMQARCVGDVVMCKRLWQFLQPDGYGREALELEHRVAAICNQITADGTPFDTDAAAQLRERWQERWAALEAQLYQQFPAVKNLNSRPQLAAMLEARGWKPERRTKKTKQPVINDEVLEALPQLSPEFTGLAEYFVLGRRLGQLANGKEAWLRHIKSDRRIHGGLIHIGTPHSRAKHLRPNVAQVPNPKKGAPFAAECRTLFRDSNGFVFVTCDQANLQDRGFAHYLAEYDGGAYAQTFADGIDQHWQTTIALGLIPEGTARVAKDKVHTVIREGAKRFRYAFLFGARAPRVGHIVADTVRAVATIAPGNPLIAQFWAGDAHPCEAVLKQTGERVLDRFMAASPGLRELRKSLTVKHNTRGWIAGLDGRRLPTEAAYKALNRIVTAAEAVICKRWLVDVFDELRARFRYGPEGDAYITLWIHDELAICCRPEIAEQVGEILVRHARSAGTPYSFRVSLDAEFKIGRDWAGTPLETNPYVEPAGEMLDDQAPALREAAKFSNDSDEVPIPALAIKAHTSTANGKIHCPFPSHKGEDKTPSCQLYADGHYHCFGCNAHGWIDEDLDVNEDVLAKLAAAPQDDTRTLERGLELWDAGKPIADTLATRYLVETRHIDLTVLPGNTNNTLRFHPRCPFGSTRHPCLLALFRDVELDTPAGIHRIALTPEAKKIERRTLGRWAGIRAIKLWPATSELVIGEGIETVFGAIYGGKVSPPAWAMGPKDGIASFPILPGVKLLTILVDNDDRAPAVAEACATRWVAAGRTVRMLQTNSVKDFNDLVMS